MTYIEWDESIEIDEFDPSAEPDPDPPRWAIVRLCDPTADHGPCVLVATGGGGLTEAAVFPDLGSAQAEMGRQVAELRRELSDARG